MKLDPREAFALAISNMKFAQTLGHISRRCDEGEITESQFAEALNQILLGVYEAVQDAISDRSDAPLNKPDFSHLPDDHIRAEVRKIGTDWMGSILSRLTPTSQAKKTDDVPRLGFIQDAHLN